jgi:dolichol-phosphate mannosyltransferase
MIHAISGVPKFDVDEYAKKSTSYCLLIPIINEGKKFLFELERAQHHGIHRLADLIICDGGSTDGSTDEERLMSLGVNSLLVKRDVGGRQGAQLRMGLWWALERGYKGFITIDGTNKDSIEDVPSFIMKLDEGYDFVQGSRFIKGGRAINTPKGRYLAIRLIHAPVISLTAREKFTDTTNAFRAYSSRYISHPLVMPFRDIFESYELLAYLSVRASQLKLRTCEIPVTRVYPSKCGTPTKISCFKGNASLVSILFKNMLGKFKP